MREIKIILADAQYISSAGLRYLLSKQPHIKVVGLVGNKDELVASIASHHPDIVILDYDQPGSFALNDIPSIIENFPLVNVLIISSDDNKSNIHGSIQLGVKGFLTKRCREDELHNAINAIMNGGRFFCDSILNVLVQTPKVNAPNPSEKKYNQLTNREKEIVQLVAEGMTTKEIAGKLFLSPYTISTHRKNALKKLNIGSVPELVKFVVQQQMDKK